MWKFIARAWALLFLQRLIQWCILAATIGVLECPHFNFQCPHILFQAGALNQWVIASRDLGVCNGVVRRMN